MQYTRIFIVSILLLFSAGAKAQFTKGTRMAGASVGSVFINTGNSDQTVTSIGSTSGKVNGYGVSITPSLGWFFSEKTAAGFLVNINPSGEKASYEENGSTFQKDPANNFYIGAGAFIRNYFGSSGSLLPFGQLSLDGGINSTKKDGFFYGGTTPNVYKETYDSKSSGGFYSNASLTAGVTKMLGEYTGLDFYLGYNFSYNQSTIKTTRLRDEGIDGNIDETRNNETAGKFTNHRFVLGVGFQLFLEKRKK